ncbi:hypothetical protein ACJX0J_005569 [Zea mays]
MNNAALIDYLSGKLIQYNCTIRVYIKKNLDDERDLCNNMKIMKELYVMGNDQIMTKQLHAMGNHKGRMSGDELLACLHGWFTVAHAYDYTCVLISQAVVLPLFQLHMKKP